MRPSSLGPLIVMSGPSGVGKTTLVDRLLETSQLPLRRAITATTRAPRPGEIPDVHYHFWTKEQFREAIEAARMIEWAEVHTTDFYGTPRSEVDDYRKQGIGVLLVIDVQGAGQVRLLYPEDHISIFVCPPAFDDLANRLRVRGEADDSIRRRLATAPGELARIEEYDYHLINNNLQDAVQELERLIQTYHPKHESDR